jgi:hypothetical protein
MDQQVNQKQVYHLLRKVKPSTDVKCTAYLLRMDQDIGDAYLRLTSHVLKLLTVTR